MAALRQHTHQLSLPIQLPDTANFSSFAAGDNEAVVGFLKQSIDSPQGFQPVTLWGTEGVGKTHLLYAACERGEVEGLATMYLPLDLASADWSPDMLEGLERCDVLALDNIDAVTRDSLWCDGLFALFNRFVDQQRGTLLLSAKQAPQHLDIELPDLRSRLQMSTIFHVKEATDDHKISALQQHAQARGLTLSREVGEYLLARVSRQMSSLMALLDKLDQASMREQRRLTLPFVKQTLEL